MEVGRYFPLPGGAARLEAVARTVLDGAAASSNRQLVANRIVVALTTDADLLRGWLSGDAAPDGLVRDEFFRWQVLRSLCRLGAAGADEIAAERERDPSSQGALHALECESALPDPASKADVWHRLTSDAALSNYELYSLARFFFLPSQVELTAPYVERYFTDTPATARFRTGWMVERVAALAYPRYAVSADTVRLAERVVHDPELPSGVRRSISDATDDLRRVLASRETFGE